jgi:carbonic anhydrase
MQKLVKGIVDFRRKSLNEYRDKFSNLAYGQSPDTLFVACCDSRVVPNTFASTDPGDLFVLRNIGNLICPYHHEHHIDIDESTVSALEFSIEELKVHNIVICGHSECAAIKAVIDGRKEVKTPHLRSWLSHAEPAYSKFKAGFSLNNDLEIHNKVSQINVLQQLEHLKTYPIVREALSKKILQIHGWWFDLETANVYHYCDQRENFILIDEQESTKMLKQIS